MGGLLILIGFIAAFIYSLYRIFSPEKVQKIKIGDTKSFRVGGEYLSLFLSLGITLLILLVLLRVTVGMIALILVAAVIMVKIRQHQLLGQAIKVNGKQFSRVYKLVQEAVKRLGMEEPDVYVIQSPVLNAFALGVFGKKTVVLHSQIIEVMSDEELLSIIGHECTHIKYNHTQWITLTGASQLVHIPLLSMILHGIFLFWSRRAEYTADRGGLLACNDVKASTSALIKLSVGENLAKEFDFEELLQQEDKLNHNMFATFSESLSTHPYTLKRISALHKFYNDSAFTHFKYV